MAALNQKGGKVFFLGARDNSLSKIVARATTDYPRLIVATLSPPFGQWSPDENGQILRSIRDFQPDILWVGMTAPKQEKWVAANLSQLNTHLIGSIGAVFDYYAGVTPRAPQWICNLGVEWLYRLPREPLRLWRRTVVSAPLFLWFSFLQRLRK
jgi:N-acetylglucosaminyldiphosphoundecaprenol N-acetyl-beta-D-mannosaminyltransferase